MTENPLKVVCAYLQERSSSAAEQEVERLLKTLV